MMNYYTALASSPTFEFPYSGYPTNSALDINNDINAILAGITPATNNYICNPAPSITLQCVPQVNTSFTGNTTVYQVPEDMPVDMILEKLGVNRNTLQPYNGTNNCYTTTFQPVELLFPAQSSHCRRRLVCREVSDSDDEGYLRRPSSDRHRRSSGPWYNEQQQSPLSLHNVLSKVWEQTERASRNIQPSRSAPNINSQWQAMRNNTPPVPPSRSMNNIWESMRNAPTSFPNREAVHDFNAVRNLPYGINTTPPPPLNREAVHDFNAVRNLPYGVNAAPSPPPFYNREAVHDFNAVRNLPYGINAAPSPPPFYNREAVHDFNAVRNLPYGINAAPSPPPFYNREAVHDFNAVRNLPYGVNTRPSNSAINNFFAARNIPGGINQPNPAILNAWNRANYGPQQGPPMINAPWNQRPPSPPLPMNNMWSRMQQGGPMPSYPPSPMGPFQRGPANAPAPMSFAALLSEAHRRRLPYSGAS